VYQLGGVRVSIRGFPITTALNIIGGKYLRALKRPNKGKKYNSNTLKNRSNRIKKLASLNRCFNK
jgi:hypothetical protein